MKLSKKSDNFGKLRGWPAFLHKMFLVVSYPFRKPLIFIPVAVLLYLAPTFRGVKPTEVHLWYWGKIKSISSTVTASVTDKTKDILPETAKNLIQQVTTPEPEKGIDQLVEMPRLSPKAVRRQMFEKAKSAPVAVDILETEEALSVPGFQNSAEGKNVAEQAPVSENAAPKPQTVTVPRKLPLVYLDIPKEISGDIKVNNANEIEVGGTYLFLYGVYINPDSSEGINAKNFLEIMTKGQKVRCTILAYTYQDIATGICYVGTKNINQTLVDEGLSRNVAL